MASILLSYVESDKPVAAELAAVLRNAGHSVDTRDREGPQTWGYVIVIWSAASVVSTHLYEDARLALNRSKLVQAFTADFDTDALPAVFRAHPQIPVSDHEQLLRALPVPDAQLTQLV